MAILDLSLLQKRVIWREAVTCNTTNKLFTRRIKLKIIAASAPILTAKLSQNNGDERQGHCLLIGQLGAVKPSYWLIPASPNVFNFVWQQALVAQKYSSQVLHKKYFHTLPSSQV